MIARYIVLGLSYAAIIVWTVYLVRCEGKRLYALAPLLWLINVAAFWSYRLLDGLTNPQVMNDWSVGIYFQALITILGAGIIALRDGLKKC